MIFKPIWYDHANDSYILSIKLSIFYFFLVLIWLVYEDKKTNTEETKIYLIEKKIKKNKINISQNSVRLNFYTYKINASFLFQNNYQTLPGL